MTTTETTTETPPPPPGRLAADRLLAYKRPEPLSEEFPVPELGGTVLIEGIRGYAARRELYESMAGMKAANKSFRVTSPATGERFSPSDADITASHWVAFCVKAPALTSLQWLQFAGEGAAILGTLYERALVCSRVIPEPPAEGEKEEDALPDGEGAAERELEADFT